MRVIYKHQVAYWRTTTRYVDIETGEEITRYNAETNYLIIKTEKHVTLNFNKTKGMVELTKHCQKDLKLF